MAIRLIALRAARYPGGVLSRVRLFPLRPHPLATTIAGIMAVLAPTIGPVVGGWITWG